MSTVALALTLGMLSGLALGEYFIESARRVNVTREEDTPGLQVLEAFLECPALFPDFYIANKEPVPFELVPQFFFVNVLFTRPPDAELGDEYYEVFVVCDDRYPAQPPATATVTVTVTSRNEYPPYAPQESYTIEFSEASREGKVVGAAVVIDEDGGLDGILSFTALDDPPNPYFSLDPETGDLTLLREFDYEIEQALSSTMLIHGCDRATPVILCPNVTVTLTLTAVNDNDPQFLQPDYSIMVEEGVHRGTELMANITCKDKDIGEGSYAGIEVVVSTLDLVDVSYTETGTATLMLTAVLDYDFTNVTAFDVRLRCFDSTSIGAVRSANTTVHITVAPANDHSPQFSADQYSTSVLESLAVDSSLLTLQCSDQDRDVGLLAGMQLYLPSPAVNSTFHLDSATGLLTLVGTLDYDNPATRSFVFTVWCFDEGKREAFTQISISTLPVSDEKLTFQRSVFSFTVERLTNVHSKIGQVIAIDGDQGEVPIIAYSIEINDLFDIDAEGYIILTDHLSRDKGDFFNLTVEARDNQGTIAAQVEISVTGVLSLLEVINVVIAVFGLIVVVIIGVLVALCSYFCWKLYRVPPEANVSEVPVFMRGDMLPYTERHIARGHHVRHSSSLQDRTTLSLQRAKKKAKQGPKRKARRRPGVRNSFVNPAPRPGQNLEDVVLFGHNPQDTEMTLFRNEEPLKDTEDEWKEEDEAYEGTQNLFNPEHAGLMLGDIMLFPGEDLTRWNQADGENDSILDWAQNEEEQRKEDMSEPDEEGSSEDDGGGSVEWNPSTSAAGEWDPDTDSLTLTSI